MGSSQEEQLGAGKMRPARGIYGGGWGLLPRLSCGHHLLAPCPLQILRYTGKNLAGSFCTVCLFYRREMGTMTAAAGAGDHMASWRL